MNSIKTNIVMMGMPGSGKTTCGMLLAQRLNRDFLDVDRLIEKREGMLLQEIINNRGLDAMKAAEEAALVSIQNIDTIIAPGGSAIYYEKGMAHLRDVGIIVYLRVSCDEIINRIKDAATRGLVMKPGQTLQDLYNERIKYYEKYADITIDCDGDTVDQTMDKIMMALSGR